jgi:transposase
MSKKKVNIDLSNLKRLGIDEIALRKGQKDFVVVLVDLDRRQLIGMAESRKQEDVKKVLSGWGVEVLDQILEVSIDLSGNYKGLVHKMIPNADIIADRFHVMKLVNQELNTARNSVIKANEENKNEAEKTRVLAALKQSKYALLKPEARLTDKQKVKLEEVKNLSSVSRHA